MVYGLNVQGDRCGVYGESGVDGIRETFNEGVGVHGSGKNFGVVGVGNRGIAGVYGQNQSGRIGAIGVAAPDGTGVVGASLRSVGNPLATWQTLPSTSSGGSGTGVWGISGEGIGVHGDSESNTGVFGHSVSGIAVHGISENSTCVFGQGTSGFGVHGASKSNAGVVGQSESNTGVFGTSPSHIGVHGASESGTGVIGQSTSGLAGQFIGDVQVNGNLGIGASAPFFQTQISGGSGAPILGAGGPGTLFIGDDQATNHGSVLIGYVNGDQPHGWIQSYGAQALHINPIQNNTIINATTGNVGIGTINPQAKLHVEGDLHVNGVISKTQGGELVVQPNPVNPSQDIVYATPIGGEVGTYLRGTGKLDKGQAVIELPEHFGFVTANEGLTVQLTPRGEWLQLYVVELDTAQFVVREAQGKSGTFDYLIQGVRRGYEQHEVIRTKR